MSRSILSTNDYRARLLKLIPSEIIAAYLAIQGLVSENLDVRQPVLLFTSVFLFLLIPFYLRRVFSVKSWGQVIVTMLSFVVWVFSLGGPFLIYSWYNPVIGSVGLILWTLTVPVFSYTTDV